MNLEEKKKFIINFSYFAIWTIIIFLLFKFASAYLLPFIIGVIVAYVVQKPALFISGKLNIKKQNCAAFLSVTVFGILILAMVLFGWLLYRQITNILNYIIDNMDEIENYSKKLFEKFDKLIKQTRGNTKNVFNNFSDKAISGTISTISSFLSNGATLIIKNVPILIISCFVTVVSTFYIAKDYEKLIKFLKGIVGEKLYKKLINVKNIISQCFLKFTVGYFWLFVITWAELLIGFLLLGVRNFVLISLLVAFLDLLPIIGTGTVLLPWAIVMFFINKYWFGVGLVLIYIVITVIRNFIEPKIIGKQIGINPLFTLLFVFLGMRLGGFFGMLFLPVGITVLYTYYRKQIYTTD
ncbi:MAG: AI-2E family transporter [Clostridia bacterium]|nr:AI-2E family transporter [Clostridia bacterium]